MILKRLSIYLSASIVPIVVCICLHFGLGGLITGLKFGIVNGEVESHLECFNDSLITTRLDEYECVMNHASCEFINRIDDDFATKVRSMRIQVNQAHLIGPSGLLQQL